MANPMTPPTNPSTRERDETITEARERVAILRECMAQPREKGSTVLGWKRYVDGLDREASRVESLLALLEDGERVEGHTVPMWLMDEVQRAIDKMGPASEWRGLLCALKYVSGRQLSQAEKDHALTIHPTEETCTTVPAQEHAICECGWNVERHSLTCSSHPRNLTAPAQPTPALVAACDIVDRLLAEISGREALVLISKRQLEILKSVLYPPTAPAQSESPQDGEEGIERYVRGTSPFTGYTVHNEAGEKVFGFCLRDDTAELRVLPDGPWYRVDRETGRIELMSARPQDTALRDALEDDTHDGPWGELLGLSTSPGRGRWSKDRFEEWQGSLRLAIKHCREDLRTALEATGGTE